MGAINNFTAELLIQIIKERDGTRVGTICLSHRDQAWRHKQLWPWKDLWLEERPKRAGHRKYKSRLSQEAAEMS